MWWDRNFHQVNKKNRAGMDNTTSTTCTTASSSSTHSIVEKEKKKVSNLSKYCRFSVFAPERVVLCWDGLTTFSGGVKTNITIFRGTRQSHIHQTLGNRKKNSNEQLISRYRIRDDDSVPGSFRTVDVSNASIILLSAQSQAGGL